MNDQRGLLPNGGDVGPGRNVQQRNLISSAFARGELKHGNRVGFHPPSTGLHWDHFSSVDVVQQEHGQV